MRVRPFFWLLLAAACIGVLVFAIFMPVHDPAVIQVHVNQQHPAPVGYTTVTLHLTDTQGLPIDEAQVFSRASMTNMAMVANQSSVSYLGQGNYVAHLRLYMAGPWSISVQVQADGFATVQQTLFVQVQ